MSKLSRVAPLLNTQDLPGTIAFYRDVLGFELASSWPEESPTWCCLTRDDIEVMFTVNDHEPGPPNLTGVIYFWTDDVLALHERVKDQAEIRWGPEIYHYGMHEFALRDNNGYTLAFGQPTDAPPTCEE